jgi:6-phosphogluconolactonase
LAQTAASDWQREIAGLRAAKAAAVSTALAGGRIAREFFTALASLIKAERVSLEGVHFFWGDERCVPPDDPESNFRLANEFLFRQVTVPSQQIHRLRGEIEPREAAVLGETELRQFTDCPVPKMPQLDLVLLGVGENGHVASLFPEESEEQMANPAVYRAVTAVKPPPQRITMGYGVLAAARQVWVLASGEGKHQALQESLAAGGRTPLARVLHSRHSTRIYSDIA